ncbi:MAG: sulfite exporter TauE/SafE family protein [Planctomycetota bacterium]|nr:MAG: sulfite exporter TauE/SafE family protein [Planctomycetota bacterium]
MTLHLTEIVITALVGLAAGTLGGMLGIGGSIIMIPALALLFPGRGPDAQHLFQAAAMAVNVAVSLPAAIRHARAGAVRRAVLMWLLPAGLAFILLGVWLSNQLDGGTLRRIFAAFLLYLAAQEIVRVYRKSPDHNEAAARVTPARAGTVGAVLGSAAGLLGIGGGILAVPLAQRLCRLPLRQAIAASSATMCMTAGVGAAVKIGTLPMHHQAPADALILAAALSPTAIAGAWVGASLTHRMPIHAMRGALAVLLLLAAWRMSGL